MFPLKLKVICVLVSLYSISKLRELLDLFKPAFFNSLMFFFTAILKGLATEILSSVCSLAHMKERRPKHHTPKWFLLSTS